MVKAIVAVVIGGVALSLAYFAGVFVTSFDTNMCYSNAMEALAQESTKALLENRPERASAYQSFVAKLPLHGYETNCNEVAKAVMEFQQSNNAK